MGSAKVIHDADQNCYLHGCCLSGVRKVAPIAERLNANKAAQDVQERSEYIGESASQGGVCAAQEQTKADCASDAQPQDAPPFTSQRTAARAAGIYPGTPVYYIVPAEIMERLEKLEKTQDVQSSAIQRDIDRLHSIVKAIDNRMTRLFTAIQKAFCL